MRSAPRVPLNFEGALSCIPQMTAVSKVRALPPSGPLHPWKPEGTVIILDDGCTAEPSSEYLAVSVPGGGKGLTASA
jgi:hypothetical protein